MTAFYLGVARVLLLNMLTGLIRVVRGPTPADRMVAALLLGTTGAAVLLVLAEATSTPALRDVTLVLVTLAVVFVTAFAGAGRGGPGARLE